MRNFDYTSFPAALLTPEISGLISAIHEYRGKQDLYITAKRDILQTLLEAAIIQSTDASNRIEGIFTSDARLKDLVEKKIDPANRDEEEIAGYRDVLATIHENYDDIPLSPNTILQLHRDLYGFQASGMGGHWKNSDNVISETGADGKSRVRFTPIPAFETPEAMERLCRAYTEALQQGTHDPLLLTALFVFDFLCVHPFNDGNGRMSRLLTLLLLYRNKYIVGKYISIEMLIEKSKETYYETLQASSFQWNENGNDYQPFIRYLLGIILKAYREFESRVEHIVLTRPNKANRIRMIFEQKLGRITKGGIAAQCPDISQSMIERTLKTLLEEEFIAKVGGGRSTAYVKR